jgi:hypothetical protein
VVTGIVITNIDTVAWDVRGCVFSKGNRIPFMPYPTTLGAGSAFVMDKEIRLSLGDQITMWTNSDFKVTYLIYGHV